MVEVKSLSGSAKGFAPVREISFKLQNGQIYGVLGNETSGGSTLLALLAGVLSPYTGEVRLGGFDTVKNAAEARRQVGYLPSACAPTTDLTPLEYLLLVADLRGLEYNRSIRRIQELLDWASLDGKRDTLIAKLSPSEIRLLGIAGVLLGDPQFLMLDEVTSSLPVRDAAAIRKWLEDIRGEKTVFWHAQNAAELRTVCDRILILQDGVLVDIVSPDSPIPESAEQKSAPAPRTSKSDQKPTRWSLLSREYEVIDTEDEEERN